MGGGSPSPSAASVPGKLRRVCDKTAPIARRRSHTLNARSPLGYACHMADAADQPLDQQLEEIGAQLAWVRDYL